MAALQKILASRPQMASDVENLRSWLEKQKHLPGPLSDEQLVMFLNSNENSLEATKKCMDAYFTIKSNAPEYFHNRDPLGEDIQQAWDVVDIAMLTALSPEGYRYIFCRLADKDPSHYYPETVTKLVLMVLDAAVRHDTLAPGFIFINDVSGGQMEHMTRAKLSSLKKYMRYVQEAMPVKVKCVHAINVMPVIHMLVSFVRPFMSKEHFELIRFHSADQGMEELYKAVPQRILPRDYGGEDDTVENLKKKCQQDLASCRDWFLEEEEQCYVDESKRVGNNINDCGDFFGQNGSFKQLELD